MKYVVLVGDGMADRPLASLNGLTPLQAAATSNMDDIARRGRLGRVCTVPTGFAPGSDIANLVILGYDPARHYTGRGPLEAASMGVTLGPADVAYRCNLVHLSLNEPRPRMVDFSAGHVSTEDARAIMGALDAALGSEAFRFHPGVSYRNLLVWHRGATTPRTTPPHDIIGHEVGPYLPAGDGAEDLVALIQRSQELLAGPLKSSRSQDRPNPPNSIWPWGQGLAPSMEPITHRWGIRGVIITAVDLLKGLGIYSGLHAVDVPGATGYYDTDYRGKAQQALHSLAEGYDLAFVHVEAPDEAGHQGSVQEKIRAIESFDRDVVGTVMNGLQEWQRWGVLVLPDHATPIEVRTHTAEPVPFAVRYTDDLQGGSGAFHESAAAGSRLFIEKGMELLGRFLQRQWGES
jgi:2,3-bisphosphoglycerate-independent phosphoglycerate mutase